MSGKGDVIFSVLVYKLDPKGLYVVLIKKQVVRTN